MRSTDAFPSPYMQEILEALAGAGVFTTLDLHGGYWQVQMDKDSQGKTAFVCWFGLYQFKVMPFRFKDAPATFQRLMWLVLEDLHRENVFVHLDDIHVYSAAFRSPLRP